LVGIIWTSIPEQTMRIRTGLGLLLLSTAAACAADSGGQGQPTAPAVDGPAAATTAVLNLRPVISGLSRPLDVENAGDGSGRLFIAEQDGRILVLADGKLQRETFLDIAQVRDCDLGGSLGRRPLGFTPSSAGQERGLLGLAFHPRFHDNGLLFVDFTDGEGDTVVARFHLRADGRTVDPSSCAVVMRVDQPFSNHNGGDLEFGPDRLLYIGLGDGGSGNDPCNHASTLSAAAQDNTGPCAADSTFVGSGGNADSRTLLGKILRVDVDRSTAAGAPGLCAARADGSAMYAAPADNAPAKTGANTCGEIWTYGWRNPWRFSFDRQSGDLYVGDVGQDAVEEISRIDQGASGGGNYGWRGCEGDRDANGGHCAGSLPPWLTYGHEHGRCSVTGGLVYRGPDAGLQGRYLFGDFCTGEIYIAEPQSGTASFRIGRLSPPTHLNIASFGEDEAGRAYVVDLGVGSARGGAVYELRSGR
jgi:glucose/arabinose dehydrogenase